jgi:hypothetical protein
VDEAYSFVSSLPANESWQPRGLIGVSGKIEPGGMKSMKAYNAMQE